MLVVEMFISLNEEFHDLLAAAFVLRLLHHHTEDIDECWSMHFVTLLRKKVGAKFLTEFRPIAVIQVLWKLYSKVLELLTEHRFN
jgi:hypothetical protein